jgi:hypothetical protein
MGKRCPYLLLSLLGVLLIYPYLLDRPQTELLLVVLNTTVVLSAIYAVSDNRRHLVTAVIIGIPQMILSALNVVQSSETLAIPQAALTAGIYGYALVRVLDYVLRGKEVGVQKIYAALTIYLLIGYTWAACYDLVATLQPHAFFVTHGQGEVIEFRTLVHFSFVTLTSLGYGDITPVTDQARSLAFLEAIVGNLYLAVLVARLVGMYRPDPDTVRRRTTG